MSSRITLAASFLVALVSTPGLATTHVVTSDGTGDFPTIQAAILAAADGDSVELADGTFTGDGNRDIDFAGRAITVLSQSGVAAACVIDCEGSEADPHRGFLFVSGEDSASVLQGVKVTGGYIDPSPQPYAGAAVLCESAAPTFKSCVFHENTAATGSGGAMMIVNTIATTKLIDCDFTLNQSSGFGGGSAIACDGGYLNSIDCNFSNNTGGALYTMGGTFTGCAFSGNAGDGVYGGSGSYDFIDCVFSSNAGRGAAFSHCSVFMVDCLFLENQGGIWADYMDGMHLTNLTFYGNAGAAIAAELYTIVSLDNSIIAFGTGGEPVTCLGGDVLMSCCDVYGNADGDWVGCISGSEGLYGNICEKPLFCDPDNSDFMLAENSPCLPGNHPDGEDCGLIGAYGEGCGPVVAVEGSAVSSALSLAPATPNPFEASARIRYVVPPALEGSLLYLRVYDSAGRLVRTLVNGRSRDGVHEVSWDGRSDAGTPVAGGVYFYQLGLNGTTQTRRVILVR